MRVLNTEVPAEVMCIIANYLVSDDIREAWRLRGVCGKYTSDIWSGMTLT